MSKCIEWRLEPTDEHGDIIDPLFYCTKKDATNDITAALRDFQDAVYVDVCRVERYGNDGDGVTNEDYDYRTRHYRDGRVVPLTTAYGLEPKAVTR